MRQSVGLAFVAAFIISFCGLGLVPFNPVCGQSQRLELGRRLQRFENAWQSADARNRAACVTPLKSAVSSFFSLRLSEAGRSLDVAWQTARGAVPASPFEQSVVGLQLIASPVCADVSQQTMTLELRNFYKTNTMPPADTRVVIVIRDNDGRLLAESSFPGTALNSSVDWTTGALPEGDHRLSATLQSGTESFGLPEIRITRVSQLSERLDALRDKVPQRTSSPPTPTDSADLQPFTVQSTCRSTISFLTALSEGQPQEADFPALSRLRLCESMTQPDAEISQVLQQHGQSHDLWLTLANARRSVPARIRCPASPQGPMPVLFVFHGAGGSENMFFEAYGAGRVVEEAQKRGWLVVAPGQGFLGLALGLEDMLAALETCFPVDRQQVLLLGHSMGAAQVMRQMQQHPGIARAAVALGGGGRLAGEDVKRFAATPWFVAAGAEDFGRRGALQLHDSLQQAGGKSVYQDFPDVEHLVIVQAAIPATFEFFDATLRSR